MTWHTDDSDSLEKIYVLPCTAKWWKPRVSEYAAIPPLKVNQYLRAPKLHTDRFLTAVHMNKSIVHMTFFWQQISKFTLVCDKKFFRRAKKLLQTWNFQQFKGISTRGVSEKQPLTLLSARVSLRHNERIHRWFAERVPLKFLSNHTWSHGMAKRDPKR